MSHREHPVSQYQHAGGADVQLIDVREPSEVASGTLPGAVNIPLRTLPGRLAELDPSRPVAVLCRSGARSGQAARWLAGQGFPDVVNLTGGMMAARG